MPPQPLRPVSILALFNPGGISDATRDLGDRTLALIREGNWREALKWVNAAYREGIERKNQRDSVSDRADINASALWHAYFAVIYTQQTRFADASQQAEYCYRLFNNSGETHSAIVARVLLGAINLTRLERMVQVPVDEWRRTLAYFDDATTKLTQAIRNLEGRLGELSASEIAQKYTPLKTAIDVARHWFRDVIRAADQARAAHHAPAPDLTWISLFNLSSLVETEDTDNNRFVESLLLTVERARRQRDYDGAISEAEQILKLLGALPDKDPNMVGKARLYASLASFCSGRPDQIAQALEYCKAAMADDGIKPNTHNHAMALLFWAQLERERGNLREALGKFMDAHKELNTVKPRRRDPQDDYEHMIRSVNVLIEQLRDQLLGREPAAPSGRARPVHIDLRTPIELIWPDPDAVGPEVMPVFGQMPDGDYEEVRQVSINDRPYAVHPPDDPDGESVRLRVGARYIPMQVRTNGTTDDYVLVRQENRLGWDDQFVAAGERHSRRAWAFQTGADRSPRIIGGERNWTIIDNSNVPRFLDTILGVVEALLTHIDFD